MIINIYFFIDFKFLTFYEVSLSITGIIMSYVIRKPAFISAEFNFHAFYFFNLPPILAI